MKIRVLHIVLSMETGGLENGIVNLTNNADADNYTVDVLCLRERGELADRITNPNSQVLFDNDRSHSLLTAIKKIYKTCKTGNYHVIHSHGFTTMLAGYIAGKLARTPIIMNGEHGTLYHSSSKQRIAQKILFKKMNANLTVSEDLIREIRESFNLGDDNFQAIINGVDTEKFKPDKKIGAQIRQDLNLSNSDILIGSVGRLVEVKNYKSLINAFSLICHEQPHVHLVLAGSGPERKSLENQINHYQLNKRIHLLGRRDDIPRIMNAIDIFVLPSFSEGLSNTLLEAMSCGTPVIASDVGGNGEIIVPQITGYLYESNNDNGLANLLGKLVNNPKHIQQLSELAREHILVNYSLSSMVNNYEAVYSKLMHKTNLTQ